MGSPASLSPSTVSIEDSVSNQDLSTLFHELSDPKMSTDQLMFGARQTGSPPPATSLSADTPPAAPWTPNSTEQSMLRDVAKTTDDPAQFASIMKEKVATFRAENSGTDDMFKGSPYDQGPEKLDQYLTDQFESTKLSLNTELADQEARAVK
jgi:hypothetical protein